MRWIRDKNHPAYDQRGVFARIDVEPNQLYDELVYFYLSPIARLGPFSPHPLHIYMPSSSSSFGHFCSILPVSCFSRLGHYTGEVIPRSDLNNDSGFVAELTPQLDIDAKRVCAWRVRSIYNQTFGSAALLSHWYLTRPLFTLIFFLFFHLRWATKCDSSMILGRCLEPRAPM